MADDWMSRVPPYPADSVRFSPYDNKIRRSQEIHPQQTADTDGEVPSSSFEDSDTNASSPSSPGKEPKNLPRKLAILFALALAGVLTGVSALIVFPERPPLINPDSFSIWTSSIVGGPQSYELDPTSGAPITLIQLEISPGKQSTTMTFSLWIQTSPKKDPGRQELIFRLYGDLPVRCPKGLSCYHRSDDSYAQVSGGAYTEIVASPIIPLRKYSVTIMSSRFGFSSNGKTAIADLPAVEGPIPTTALSSLSVQYDVQGSDSYDWSVPAVGYLREGAFWSEPLNSSSNSSLAEEATGINLQAQGQDEQDIFISGILLGVAGAAGLALLQEILHMLLDANGDQKSSQRRYTRR